MDQNTKTLTVTQAQRVFEKFGSAAALHRALKAIGKHRNIWTIESWGRPKDKAGTGGVIPSHNWPFILKAAHHAGVTLTETDMDPRPSAVLDIAKEGKRVRR